MLTQEDDVEIDALLARGWSKAAIVRHTGRDRKTVAKYLARPRGERRDQALSCLGPFRGYLEARFEDDPHVEATVLSRQRCPQSPTRGFGNLRMAVGAQPPRPSPRRAL
jgi:transposase